ncbi:MAG: XylR family transcriptional regulator [Opitutaceae bacterium]|nr:XylR family transcriptional regulator [Opitutaceae bacterium]
MSTRTCPPLPLCPQQSHPPGGVSRRPGRKPGRPAATGKRPPGPPLSDSSRRIRLGPSVLISLGWYASKIHRGIARFARQANWSLNISSMRSGRPPRGWRGDGIICSAYMDAAPDAAILDAGIPVVQIGNRDHPDAPRVASDNAAVGRMAAEYFLQRGFRRFAFFRRTGSIGETIRGEAFAARIREAGGKHSMHWLDWLAVARSLKLPDTDNVDMTWLARQIARLPRPVAIFAEYDDFAIEVLNACVAARIPVPEQAAILGVDDDPLRCELAPILLSSIDDDLEMIGYEAAAMLAKRLRGETVPAAVLIPPRGVTTRLSTDILAIEHPLVASALRLVWDNYTRPIVAKQIAAEIPMSPRRLHDAFLKHVGHSISDEIIRKRLEHARQLLEETDKKTPEIAHLSGFTDHDRMGKIFKRVLGMTPGTWRDRFRDDAARK